MRGLLAWVSAGALVAGLAGAPVLTTAVAAPPPESVAAAAPVAVGSLPSTVPPRLTANPVKPIRGESVTVSGNLGTAGVRTVELQYAKGSKWKKVTTGVAQDSGAFSFSTATKAKTLKLRVVAAASGALPAVVSKTLKITTVAQKLKLSLPSKAGIYAKVTAKVTASPSRSGRTLTLQLKQGRKWLVAATGSTGADGRASLLLACKTTGKTTFRVLLAAANRAPAVTSAKKRVKFVDAPIPQAPSVLTGDLPEGTVGQAATLSLTATGGVDPYSWAVANLPAGLAVSGGTITGIPSQAGTFQLVYTATDLAGTTATGAGQLVVSPPLTLGSIEFPKGIVTQLYQQTVTAEGGRQPHTWKATGLPTGIAINPASGEISGTPSVPGDHTVQVTVTDAAGRTASSSATITVDPLARAISAGFEHSCAITTDRGVVCWGSNSKGQLGDGSTALRRTPVPVTGLDSGVVEVTAGGYHSCARLSSGAVKCWGMGLYGQLGDNNTADQSTPVAVDFGSPVVRGGITQVAAGLVHTCALTRGGAVKCWGNNSLGQLGTGDTSARDTPTLVSGITDAVAITAGIYHTCALTESGAVKCWGDNFHGEVGDGSGVSPQKTPTQVSGLTSGVVAVESGSSHTCAVLGSGGVQCWGSNSSGQLGNDSTTEAFTPVPVSSISNAVDAGSGGSHSCALLETGYLKCWGSNANGQLGSGSTTDSSTPVTVGGPLIVPGRLTLTARYTSITAGGQHTCALTGGGLAKCWGDNEMGAIGDGTDVTPLKPVGVKTLS